MNTFATQKFNRSHNFSLQNKAFTPRLTCWAIALILSIILHSHTAFPQETFKSDEIGLSIPAGFERVGNPSALILIRNKTQGFPTFNAVLAPGPWPYTKLDVQTQGQKVIDDYHLVGLKNAEATSIEFSRINNHQALHTRVHYNAGQNEFFSEIWIVPLVDRHIILTAVYKGQVLPDTQNMINQVISSVTITSPPLIEATSEAFYNKSVFKIALGLIAASLMLLIISRLRRKKHQG